jgi:hypothetical protein
LDGKLNRADALAWVKANIDPSGGGWSGGLREKQAGRWKPPTPMAPTRSRMEFAELAKVGDLQIPDRENEIRERATIDFINDVRQAGHIANFARMALRFGCTMQQAYAVAQWFDLFITFSFIPKDPGRAYIQVHEEPDWSGIATDAGTTANVEAWRSWMNRLLEDGIPRKKEE